jgi:hypothetical protein
MTHVKPGGQSAGFFVPRDVFKRNAMWNRAISGKVLGGFPLGIA